MKVTIEVEKQPEKKVKRSYMKVMIGDHIEPRRDMKDYDHMMPPPFVYDLTKEEKITITDKFIDRQNRNKLAVFAYKSEKQYLRYVGATDAGRSVFNAVMIIFTVIMLIFSFGLFFAYLGKKRDPALRFFCSFVHDIDHDLEITIRGRKINAVSVERTYS